jgi:hypothetical protein
MNGRRPSALGCRLIPLLMLGVLAAPLASQIPDSADSRQRTADGVRPLKPISAFWRSLLIPGWGQAVTHRWVTGAAFVVWEGTCIMMMKKAQGELDHIRAVGANHATGKRQEKEDWLTLLVFNHLFSGAEAFVSAHLQDFPEDLHVRVSPRGFSVSFPLPRP